LSWKKWIGPLLGVFFLGLVILNHNLRELFTGIFTLKPRLIFNPDLHLEKIRFYLLNADYRMLLLATVISMAQFPLRAIRWRFLLLPHKKIKFHSLFSATMIGFMANNLLPARLGEFVRAYIISRKEGVSGSSAMATIVVERLFDGLTLLTILLVVFYTYSFPGWVVVVGWYGTLIFFLLCVFIVSMMLWPNRFASILSNITRLFSSRLKERAEALILRFISGLDMLRNRRLVLIVFVISFVHWLVLGWSMSIALKSFDIEVPNSGPFFVLSIVALGLALPSSPGFVGTFQWLTERALTVYGVSKSLSLSFSSVFHLITFVPVTIIGLAYFLKEHLTWKELKRTEKEIGGQMKMDESSLEE
jgi:uncharacterized protein (TIRG00374 family)